MYKNLHVYAWSFEPYIKLDRGRLFYQIVDPIDLGILNYHLEIQC